MLNIFIQDLGLVERIWISDQGLYDLTLHKLSSLGSRGLTHRVKVLSYRPVEVENGRELPGGRGEYGFTGPHQSRHPPPPCPSKQKVSFSLPLLGTAVPSALPSLPGKSRKDPNR